MFRETGLRKLHLLVLRKEVHQRTRAREDAGKDIEGKVESNCCAVAIST